jgi:hypothetical protein
MDRTRLEIMLLLKEAEGNPQKTREIYRELQSLMIFIEGMLVGKMPPKPKVESSSYKSSGTVLHG